MDFSFLVGLLQDLGETFRLPVSFVCIEFVGTFAFAISGVRLSSAKQFDVFGAWIVGMATAIGGGTLRDLMLGVNPFWMNSASYFVCCAFAVLWVFLFGKYLIRQNNTWFLFDTIGLALFNVIGIEKSLNMGASWWVAITMGSITGAAGGVIRDVLINEVPLIFRQEIYALACVAGGLVYCGCAHLGLSVEISALLSSVCVVVIRLLAVGFKWHLPIMKGDVFMLMLTFLFVPSVLLAQNNRIYDSEVRTLRLVVDDNPVLPPVLTLGRNQHLEISWDQMSHVPQRYIYHLQHCDADWNPTEELFESDWLSGLNNQLVEDYEESFNTTQLYTHYRMTLPNPQTAFLLSGNYCLSIYPEDADVDSDTPVLEARFCVYEQKMGIRMQVSGNTDVDFNKSHQQVSLAVDYGGLNVVDPEREVRTLVLQNHRWDNHACLTKPNMRSAKGIEYLHEPSLIFPAGNEFHKLEILDVHRPSLGVERMEWFEPYYHATLFPLRPVPNYSYTQDQNGIYVLRSADDRDDDITAEYVMVHFCLQSPHLSGGDVYVCGRWTGSEYADECRMAYDEERQEYEVSVLLKQGYYDYQFRQEDGSTRQTMGDFYETENEYSILVYYRGQGARYDRLVGYVRVHTGT